MMSLFVILLVAGWIIVSALIGVTVCIRSSHISRMEDTKTVPRTIRPRYSREMSPVTTPDHPDAAPAPSSSH